MRLVFCLDKNSFLGPGIVFSKSACILNLVAFIAHAVFGCCGHHQHENSANCCGISIQHDHLDLAAGCCDSESDHDHDSSPTDSFSGICNDESSEVPCHQGERHGCDESRCSYVAASTSQDLLADLDYGFAVLWIANPVDYAAVVPQVVSHVRSDFNVLWATPPTLCAALQSWQI
jgi:hypothetical protein